MEFREAPERADTLSPPLLPQLLIQCFQVVLASHLQGEYTVEMQAAWDKFLTGVAVVLTEKYR